MNVYQIYWHYIRIKGWLHRSWYHSTKIIYISNKIIAFMEMQHTLLNRKVGFDTHTSPNINLHPLPALAGTQNNEPISTILDPLFTMDPAQYVL